MRSIGRHIFHVLFAVVVAALPGSATASWVATVDGPEPRSRDSAFAVTIDGSGDVFAVGRLQKSAPPPSPISDDDFAVFKFSGSTGAELWRQVIDKNADTSFEQAFGVAVDASGDVIAVGQLTDAVFDSLRFFTVIKFAGSAGAELWRQEIEGNRALSVAVDGSGDVIAAGEAAGFAVIKFRGTDGAEVWRREIAGTGNEARSVIVDGAGDVIAGGELSNGANGDFAVIKFRGTDGMELWRQTINGTANAKDRAGAVSVDNAGDVVAVGFLDNSSTSWDFTVIKFRGTDGSELWRHEIDGANNFSRDFATSVAVDASGDVLAAGTRNSFAVIKFRGTDGVELWRKELEGEASQSGGIANSVTVTASGDVIAAGIIDNLCISEKLCARQIHFNHWDFAVAKLRGTDGAELWRQEIDAANFDDFASSVVVDISGDVIAGGMILGLGIPQKLSGDFAVVKLRGSDGFFPPLPLFAPQNTAQRKCINELSKSGAKVAKAQGREILKCLKDGSKGKLSPQTIEACLTLDRRGKVAQAKQRTIDKAAANCSVVPTFGATDAANVNRAATQKELDLIHDVFGSDLDAAILTDKEGAKCQSTAIKQVEKCMATRFEEFNKCKRDGLRGKSGPSGAALPFTNPSHLELCMGDDPKGKIAKDCDTKLGQMISRRCFSVDQATAFPGACFNALELRFCLDRLVECRVCLAVNSSDGLNRDCDKFDDGVANSSCSEAP